MVCAKFGCTVALELGTSCVCFAFRQCADSGMAIRMVENGLASRCAGADPEDVFAIEILVELDIEPRYSTTTTVDYATRGGIKNCPRGHYNC